MTCDHTIQHVVDGRGWPRTLRTLRWPARDHGDFSTPIVQHQKLLANLGLTVLLQQSELTVTAIPSLLTHCDVIKLITAVANTLTTEAHTTQALIALLLQHIPLIRISSSEQAHTILKQMPAPAEQFNWCRQLDQSTLSSLF